MNFAFCLRVTWFIFNVWNQLHHSISLLKECDNILNTILSTSSFPLCSMGGKNVWQVTRTQRLICSQLSPMPSYTAQAYTACRCTTFIIKYLLKIYSVCIYTKQCYNTSQDEINVHERTLKNDKSYVMRTLSSQTNGSFENMFSHFHFSWCIERSYKLPTKLAWDHIFRK